MHEQSATPSGSDADDPRADIASGASAAPRSGMASSVTRHAQISKGPSEWEFLGANIDSLDLSVFVVWGAEWPEWVKRLDAAKEEASGKDGLLLEDLSCFVMPAGVKPYRWHLKYAEVDIFISAKMETGQSTPNVKLSFRSHGLWWNGAASMVESTVAVLREFGASIQRIVPSRVDIAADFNIPDGLSLEFLDAHRVPANCKTRVIRTNDRLETYYAGASASPKQLRIYDKTAEIQQNGTNTWLYEIWPKTNPQSVWRFEFQLRRAALREFGIDGFDDVQKNIFALWLYLTHSYFSLRQLDNENVTRRSVHPLWVDVQAVAENLGIECERPLAVERPPADASWYPPRIIGLVLGWAVRRRLSDEEEVLQEVGQLLREYFDRVSYDVEYVKRSIKLGFEEPPEFEGAA